MKEKIRQMYFPDEASWLKRRNLSLGGTAAAIIWGVHPRISKLELWTRRYKQLEENTPDVDPHEIQTKTIGKILEPGITKLYCLATGRKTAPRKPGISLWTNSKYPFAHYSDDMIVTRNEFTDWNDDGSRVMVKERGVLECKNTGGWAADQWEVAPPLTARIQLMHGLMVTGLKWGSVAGLIGGWHWMFRHADVARHEEFIERLAEKESAFWDSLEKGIPPKPDGSDSAKQAIEWLYPQQTAGQIVQLGPAELEAHEELKQLKEQIKQLEFRETELKNHLKMAIGEAEFGVLPGEEINRAYSFKQVRKDAYSVPEQTYRELRVVNWKTQQRKIEYQKKEIAHEQPA